ncbi:RSPH1, partial [Symbiodinium sp. KB8]
DFWCFACSVHSVWTLFEGEGELRQGLGEMESANHLALEEEILEELGCTVYNPNTDNKELYGDEADDRWLRTFCENLTRIQRENRGFVLQVQQGVVREKSNMQIAEEEMGTNWRIPRMGMYAFPTTGTRGGGTTAEQDLALAVERARQQWEEGIEEEVEMVSEWYEPIEGDRELRLNDKGELQGRARCTYTDGSVFVGEYQDGQQNGKGTYTSANGAGFVGEYQKDKKHGKGMYTYENGDVEVGVYDRGEDKGRAVKLSADRTKAWLCMDGEEEHEVSVAEEVLHSELLEDSALFNQALASCWQGHWRLAQALLSRMDSHALPRTVVSFEKAAAACSRAGRWQEALNLFEEAWESLCPPNALMFRDVSRSCADGFAWEASLELLNLACRDDAPEVEDSACAVALGACGSASRWELVFILLAESWEVGDPGGEAYSAAIRGLSRCS